jgi:hypothetical protein
MALLLIDIPQKVILSKWVIFQAHYLVRSMKSLIIIANTMENILSWEADSWLSIQEIRHPLWNPKSY